MVRCSKWRAKGTYPISFKMIINQNYLRNKRLVWLILKRVNLSFLRKSFTSKQKFRYLRLITKLWRKRKINTRKWAFCKMSAPNFSSIMTMLASKRAILSSNKSYLLVNPISRLRSWWSIWWNLELISWSNSKTVRRIIHWWKSE
jgi:hypothetical protein